MSRKRTLYSAEFKTKNDEYAKIVGRLTVERDWLAKKVRSLDSSNTECSVTSKLPNLSITKQCQLIGLTRSSLHYKIRSNKKKELILRQINSIYKEIPIYGAAKVSQYLLEEGQKICVNTVSKYRKELDLKAVLAVRSIHTTIPNKVHKKYSYKLRNLEVTRANQIWFTDITYIKTKHGFMYLAAIIAWYSKVVLSSEISTTMDADFVEFAYEILLKKDIHK